MKTPHDTRRRGAAWLLLAVFLSMLFASALHVHPEVDRADGECVECAHHLHHGHLTAGQANAHVCLLCQFLTFSFLAAMSWTGMLVTCVARPIYDLYSARVTHRHLGHRQGRAPPRCTLFTALV